MSDEPPVTGRDDLDDALRAVADLSGVPITEHVERLSRAHDIVSAALTSVPPERPDGR